MAPMIRFETESEAPMDRKIILASLLLAASPFVAGCMPDNARTHLDWGVNTAPPHHAAAKDSAKTYVYDENAAQHSAGSQSDAAPRSAPSHAPVTSQPLGPISQGARADAPVFAWPVSGHVISDFGSTANGGRNDGINIATTMDAPIHASASGTVTYAGDELKNYGNLVLIKHADGFTTAYAHADRLVVSRGDTVTKGQVIGYAGHTGDVATPQLHFEIREQTTPVNPRTYLASTTASN
jgi:murein DD-endopeptidase MepM/ murein hydrolase activator NlpD